MTIPLPTTAKQWILTNHPEGLATTTGDKPTFTIHEKPIPELKDNQVLLETQYWQNDPAQRGWIAAYEDESRLYIPPLHVGDIMSAGGIGKVLASKASHLKEGDLVVHYLGWTNYSVADASKLKALRSLPRDLPITHYIGALGSTGLTAWFGLHDVGEVKASDVVVISGAAGAAGSMAVQIAKKIVGCKKVVGIAGGKEKCDWVVNKLGADVCVDYKAADFKEQLIKATPDYADLYFDNVGGEVLDLMLTRVKGWGRITACGAIASYNDTADRATGIKNWFHIVSMRIRIRGFLVFDFIDQYPAVREKLTKALEEGKIDVTDSETVVESTFEDVPATWLRLFEGKNQGKLITKLVPSKESGKL